MISASGGLRSTPSCVSPSEKTCLLGILGISLAFLGAALDIGESVFYTSLLLTILLLALFYDENDRLEHDRRSRRHTESVKVGET